MSLPLTQMEWAQAAHLWGAAEALREAISTPVPPVYRSHQQAVAAARSQSGKEDFATAWATGRCMNPEQAVIFRTPQQPANGSF